MQQRWVCQACLVRLRIATRSTRHYSSKPSLQGLQQQETKKALLKTRNIGIIAHIDAGKTTTTERMLYYSGFTRRIGDVDDGSTVTDFLPAERARGITIQSAAITFHWPPNAAEATAQPTADAASGSLTVSNDQHTINLIDTPGHADFTFEVVRSLRVLDGAICILDGVAGVEAQTEKVWMQANNYQVPRMIYVNKLDRDGAAFNRTVHEIASRLHTWPVLCQIPWWRDGKFVGVGDVITLRGLLWEEGGDGKAVKVQSYSDLSREHPVFADEIKKARVALVEALTEHDDSIVEEFLEKGEDYLALSPESINTSLRRGLLTQSQAITPVFAGASFRNIGVQPLLDAVNAFLPSPLEAPDSEIRIDNRTGTLQSLLNNNLLASESDSNKQKLKKHATRTPTSIANLAALALAFKVVTDPKRGVLVYIRVYSGSLPRNALLYNTNLAVYEKVPRLLRMYASDAIEIPTINEGEIGVIVGLKHTRTGDTLLVYSGTNPKSSPPAPLNSLQLRPIDVPPPVFFTSVEPNSLSEERNLSDSLALLLREDPSLNVTVDPESGQTHLAGMGELHLEIARDRLINDFKVKAATGAIEISYREAINTDSTQHTEHLDREIAGKHSEASCTASVRPVEGDARLEESMKDTETLFQLPDNNTLLVSHPSHSSSTDAPTSPDTPQLPASLSLPTILQSFRTGALTALSRGPTHAFPMHSTHIDVAFNPATDLMPHTTPAALASAARLSIRAALTQAAAASESHILEPVMSVTVSVDEASLGAVVHDMSAARGGQVLSLDSDDATAEAQRAQRRFSAAELRKVYAPPDPFGPSGGSSGSAGEGLAAGQTRQIRARVPLREMVGYLKHLRSLTGGRGTFVMSVDRFERVSGQRRKALLGELGGVGYV